MTVSLRDLEPTRVALRDILARKVWAVLSVRFAGEELGLELVPDGATAWLVKLTAGETVLYDSGIAGAVVTEEELAFLLVRGFQALKTVREILPS